MLSIEKLQYKADHLLPLFNDMSPVIIRLVTWEHSDEQEDSAFYDKKDDAIEINERWIETDPPDLQLIDLLKHELAHSWILRNDLSDQNTKGNTFAHGPTWESKVREIGVSELHIQKVVAHSNFVRTANDYGTAINRKEGVKEADQAMVLAGKIMTKAIDDMRDFYRHQIA